MLHLAIRRSAELLQFAALLSPVALAQASKPALTASEVMQRVIAATGATPPPDTVDTAINPLKRRASRSIPRRW